MSKESHSFSVAVAETVGMAGSLLLGHLLFLQKSNCPEGQDWRLFWVRRAKSQLRRTYPYLSDGEIRGVFERLEKGQFIQSRIANQDSRDRTKSYRVTPDGFVLLGIEHHESPFAKRSNGENLSEKIDNSHLLNSQMQLSETRDSHLLNSQMPFVEFTNDHLLNSQMSNKVYSTSILPPEHNTKNSEPVFEKSRKHAVGAEKEKHALPAQIETKSKDVQIDTLAALSFQRRHFDSDVANALRVEERDVFFELLNEWHTFLEMRWQAHKFKYANGRTEAASFQEAFESGSGNIEHVRAVIKRTIAKQWKGFFSVKNDEKKWFNNGNTGVSSKNDSGKSAFFAGV